ncbi:uncharacterized protein LOC105693115 [Athalia rosae]|uniref:uncharacterized protein LOC105693115 n=1 Tax=Athalia rosae TaxID=37344 RepID=UPI0006264BAD|nr:uncharacterized protein LOC105693115 [Athalia rosae]
MGSAPNNKGFFDGFIVKRSSGCVPSVENSKICVKSDSDSEILTPQVLPQDPSMQLLPLYEENFLLEAIDKIIKKRWRVIGCTTRYGWLAACSYKRTISSEDTKIISALGNKIGIQNYSEAIERIENLAKSLHPRDVPAVAIAVLNELHTALMLRQRRRLKSSFRLVKNRCPTIFTISDVCKIGSTDLN